MSEQLPDLYVTFVNHLHMGDVCAFSERKAPNSHHYTPHAKLKEAEDNWRMFALVKLGVERDKMSPGDVEVIQKFLGVENEPMSEKLVINHEEATELAHLKWNESNLARSYLDLLNLLVCITHHDGAVNDTKKRWEPIVTAALERGLRSINHE